MGLEASHAGSAANPVPMRGLGMSSGIDGFLACCTSEAGDAGVVQRVARRWHAGDTF